MTPKCLCSGLRSFSQLHPKDKLGICGQLTGQSCQGLWEAPGPSLRCHLTDTSEHHMLPKIVTGALMYSEVHSRPHSSSLLSSRPGHWDPLAMPGLAAVPMPRLRSGWDLYPVHQDRHQQGHHGFLLMGFCHLLRRFSSGWKILNPASVWRKSTQCCPMPPQPSPH